MAGQTAPAHGDPVLNWLDQNLNPLHGINKPIEKAGSGVVQGVQDVASATVSTGHFLAALSQPNTWIRVGEVAVGLVLVAVGIDHMMGTNYTGKAAKAAATAAVL